MKKLFVTGGCGYIGTELIKVLLKNNPIKVSKDDIIKILND